MTIPKVVKGAALIGCAVGFIATGLVGFWPGGVNTSRAPLFAAEAGAWCIFLSICYLVFKFVRAGLRRSKH
jgi:hypothetical protein